MPSQTRQSRGIPAGGEFAANVQAEPGSSLSAAAAWPAIGYEEHPWKTDPDRGGSGCWPADPMRPPSFRRSPNWTPSLIPEPRPWPSGDPRNGPL